MDADVRLQWLQTHTIFRDLPEELVAAIAPCLKEITFEANRRLILEDTFPDALYILKSGQLESYRTQPASAAQVTTLEPGAVLHLQALLLQEKARQTLVSLSDCELWRFDKDRFQQLAEEFPQLNQELSRLLAGALDEVSQQLAAEQARQQALLPYRVTRVIRGVVGSSRYVVKLRQNIREATQMGAEDKGSILIFGEPGLNKDNLAALIHFGSANKKAPMIQVNCETLRSQDLFGRENQPGLLSWLEGGTLMLNNVQDLDDALKAPVLQLVETGQYRPATRKGEAPLPLQKSSAWILMISEKALPDFAKVSKKQIKVPPLRVRRADIEAQVNYFAQLLCKKRGLCKRKLAPEALRRLQSYDFPGNLTELESMVERAVSQSGQSSVMTEEVFWAE